MTGRNLRNDQALRLPATAVMGSVVVGVSLDHQTTETKEATGNTFTPAAVFAALMLAMSLWTQPVWAVLTPESFAPLVKELLPSVVNVRSEKKADQSSQQSQIPNLPRGFEEFFRQFNLPLLDGVPQSPLPSTSLGSGFIIGDEGLVVTNNHVIDHADKIHITLQSGEDFEAILVGTDPKTDLALLQFDPGDIELSSVEFGDSDQSEVGDWVLAIGNPLGRLGGSVTAGIISARGRNINVGPYDDFIQTDAAINRGNSGGPLFNTDGEVIGINTIIFSPNGGSIGIGFAVPSNLAETVIGQLTEFGTTRRGWLGVLIQDITDDIAESMGLGDARGALISQVTEYGPAEAAGFAVGDLILRFDGKEVESSQKLPKLVAETPVGKAVEVEVMRGGDTIMLTVSLGELEKAESSQLAQTTSPQSEATSIPQGEFLGLILQPINDALAEKFDIDPYTKGMVVVAVAPDSKAKSLQVRPGDVVVQINQHDVASLDDVASVLENAKTEGRENVLMYMKSGGSQRFIALPLAPE